MSEPQKLCTGHTAHKITGDDEAKVKKLYPHYGDVYRVKPGDWFFEEYGLKSIQDTYKMNVSLIHLQVLKGFHLFLVLTAIPGKCNGPIMVIYIDITVFRLIFHINIIFKFILTYF